MSWARSNSRTSGCCSRRPAAPGGMGAECLARSGDDPDRLDRRRGRRLRAIQRNWALYAPRHHRRAMLIQERLPSVSAKPLVFGEMPPAAPLGSWTLLDPNTLLAAPHCTSAFPNGEVRFVEDRTGPPSRAYLKLWEALTLTGQHPGPGDLCLDLGSSPGGWSWALQQMGAQVISVDKAPLDPAVACLPGIEHRCRQRFRARSGFDRSGGLAVFRCDLLPGAAAGARRALAPAGTCRRFVCTIKFQGATDHDIAARFAAIPGSTLRHLFHNKHELTWIRLG